MSPFVTDLDMDASSAEAIGADRALEAWVSRRPASGGLGEPEAGLRRLGRAGGRGPGGLGAPEPGPRRLGRATFRGALEAWARRGPGGRDPPRSGTRRRRGRAHSDPTDPAPLTAHHTPMMLHQIGPTTSQMAMCTIPSTSPVRHHAPSSTYPDPKYSGAGPLP